jgi:hypothetical protein
MTPIRSVPLRGADALPDAPAGPAIGAPAARAYQRLTGSTTICAI